MSDGPLRRPITRRSALRAGKLAALAGGLAACTSSSTQSRATSPSARAIASSYPLPSVGPTRTVAAPTATHDVRTFGAVGDGIADDTDAIVHALAALKPGEALQFPAGKVFCHAQVLTVRTAEVQLLGPGTLRATAEQTSALQVQAANVTIDGLTLAIGSTTKRWSSPDQHKLVLGAYSGAVIRNVTITGSAAAGVFGLGASNFLVQSVQVSNTRADGIHLTDGCTNGFVVAPMITSSGDDGVAVVSYATDRAICRAITVISPRVHTTTGGRGVSVVGGQQIVYADVQVSNSNAAAVYIACEGGDSVTMPVTDVRVTGGALIGSNTNPNIDHGAVLVYSGRPSGGVSDVVITGLRVTGTRLTASRQVGVVANPGAQVSAVSFVDLDLTALPKPYQGDAPAGSVTLRKVTADGATVPSPG